jgi:hypothetical protein
MAATVAAIGGVAGTIGGAVSTCFFNTPALNRTALKIVGLGALQGAVVQALGLTIGLKATEDTATMKKVAVIHFVSAAILTGAAKVLLGTTYKEAFANCAISYALTWGIIWIITPSDG